MRGCGKAGAVALLALGTAPGCEIARPPSLDPDVVAITAVLEAGEREARLLAWHPHPGAVSDPDITVEIEGPGWKTSFSQTADPCRYDDSATYGVCLEAALPEAVRPGARYGLSGEGPLGTFTGTMEMPTPPVLIEPRDTLFARVRGGYIFLPLRYRVDRTIGMLVADIGGGCGWPAGKVDLESAGVDTVAIRWIPLPCPKSPMRLAGVGLNYARFIEAMGADHFPVAVGKGDYILHRPWPESGIQGEGVYGYFDGVGYSRTVIVVW